MSENLKTRVCPHLGLAADASSSYSYPSTDHLCYRWPEPGKVGKDHQVAFCLSEEFRDCFRLVSPEAPSAAEKKSGGTGSRGLFRLVAAAVVILALLFGGGYAFLGGQLLGGGAPPPQPTATAAPIALPPAPSATPTVVPSPSPSATPEPATPTATVEPTVEATATDVPTPTGVPSPTATPGPRVHLVRSGETLGMLSRTYGITVEELARANGLQANPNLILTGQTLVIPEPRR